MESWNCALGALLGAAVGDAAGAVLEFEPDITEEDVDWALTMPGGGCWRVGPGQFTDDTELALCLAAGLVGHPPSAGFPASRVARQYAWWCNRSSPFDIGGTTQAAFCLPDYAAATAAGSDIAAQVQARARNPASLASQANGATMRAAPLAIWGHRLAPAAIAAAAAADARLSHPSRACQDANAAYALALAALIRQPGDAAAALAAAEGWAAEFGCSDVQSWLAAARDDALMAAYRAGAQQGWVRHGLQLAFYHLRRRSGYEPGLRHVLLAGGDTDTNAAIVGGMLGALHGASGIPAAMRAAVQDSGSATAGRKRPEELWGRRLEPLAQQLFAEAVRDAEAEALRQPGIQAPLQ